MEQPVDLGPVGLGVVVVGGGAGDMCNIIWLLLRSALRHNLGKIFLAQPLHHNFRRPHHFRLGFALRLGRREGGIVIDHLLLVLGLLLLLGHLGFLRGDLRVQGLLQLVVARCGHRASGPEPLTSDLDDIRATDLIDKRILDLLVDLVEQRALKQRRLRLQSYAEGPNV